MTSDGDFDRMADGETATPPRPPEKPRKQPVKRDDDSVQPSKRSWQAIALALLLIAVLWLACGSLFVAFPIGSKDSSASAGAVWKNVARGCCIGPAFALGFLAFCSASVGRRQDRRFRTGEWVAALGVTIGLLPLLLGLALIAPFNDKTAPLLGTLCCVLPGFAIISISALFYVLFGRQR